MAYYTLLTREFDGKEYGKWSIQFGDYERSVVVDEIEDSYNSPSIKTKIVQTRTARQSEIDAIVQKLNHERL